MILACSQGLRGALIVWALTLTSTLTYPPHHSLCLPLTPPSSVSLLPMLTRFLPQSTNSLPLTPPPPLTSYLLPYLQATAAQSDGESDGDESHGAMVLSGVVAACPGSCPQWQSLELSGSCLPFLWPGWPSSACQPPWWSLADIQYNLLGAVRPTHISPLTSLPRCLLQSWQRLHVLLYRAAGWSFCLWGTWFECAGVGSCYMTSLSLDEDKGVLRCRVHDAETDNVPSGLSDF